MFLSWMFLESPFLIEDVFVMFEDLCGYAAVDCEVCDCEENAEDLDSENCASFGWTDQCFGFLSSGLIVNVLYVLFWVIY